MDWNQVGAVGSLIGGISGLVAVAVTIWPVPQIRSRRAYDVDRGKIGTNIKVIGAVIGVSLILSLVSIYGAWRKSSLEWNNDRNHTTISGKTFTNEIVRLDGYVYENCTFEHVTLKYDGTESISTYQQ